MKEREAADDASKALPLLKEAYDKGLNTVSSYIDEDPRKLGAKLTVISGIQPTSIRTASQKPSSGKQSNTIRFLDKNSSL